MSNQAHPEYQYLNLLKDIKENGSEKKLFFTPEVLQQYKDKNEEPPYIKSVFGRQIRFDLSKGFPLLTTKKVFIRGIIIELLWFLRGDTNIKFLVDNNVHIWDEWAYKRYYKLTINSEAAQSNSRSSASGSQEAKLRAQTQLNSDQAQSNLRSSASSSKEAELQAQTQLNSDQAQSNSRSSASGSQEAKLQAQTQLNSDQAQSNSRSSASGSQEAKLQAQLSQKEFIEKIKNSPADSDFVKTWGDLICVYGKMWRRWPASDGREIDQLGWCIQGLKDKPFRKSYVVSAWNPDFIYAMASAGNANEVPPFCHTTYQFQVTGDNTLNLGLYQRSADVFLGVPFNIASYALLLMMVAQITGLKPGEFVHTFGDVHIYSNHFDAVNEQLSREPKPFPAMKLNPEIKNIDDFKYEDFILEGYDPHPAIKAEIANIGGF